MYKFRNVFIIILAMCTFCANQALADGGIPLWTYYASSILVLPVMGYNFFMLVFCIYIALFFLLFITLVEALVVKWILKIDFIKSFNVTFQANLISTIAGAFLTALPLPYYFVTHKINSIDLQLLGPWGWNLYTTLFWNIALFLLSFIIEYKLAQRKLDNCNKSDIKRAYLYANIITYILPILILILLIIVKNCSN